MKKIVKGNDFTMRVIVTERHKKAVRALQTVEEVEAYDYTVGYPEKLAL